MLTKQQLEQTIDFIFSREQPEGGFSFAGKMPPTLEDTYYAIATLKIIEKILKRKISIKDRTLNYIKIVGEDTIVDYRLKYQSVWLCKLFEFDYSDKEKGMAHHLRNLEQLYYFILLNYDLEKTNYKSLFKNKIDKLRYVSDLAYTVLVYKKLNINFDNDLYAGKIHEIQNLDGGFGFDKGSTTFLENTYLAVKALSALNKNQYC